MLSSYATGSVRCARTEPFDPADGLRRAMSAMREAHERRRRGGADTVIAVIVTAASAAAGRRASASAASASGPVAPAVRAAAGARRVAATSARPRCCCSTEEPRNGYQIMQEVEQRWTASGARAPARSTRRSQQLEDEGLIRSTDSDGRKLFEITDDGRARVAERARRTRLRRGSR